MIRGYRKLVGYWGYKGLEGVRRGDRGLQVLTRGYKGLDGVTRG